MLNEKKRFLYKNKDEVRRGWGTSFRGQRRAQRGADRHDLSPEVTKKKYLKQKN